MNDATQFFDTAAPTGYNVERSLRFNSSDSAYLSRTPASAGNRKTWTWAGWVKRSGLSSTQRIFSSSNSSNTEGFYCELLSGDTLSLYDYSNPTIFWQKTTTQVFRDASAWFHLQVTFDSTNATAGDRVKLYVNGVLVTAFSTSSNPSLNYDSYWNAARVHAIGRTGDSNAGYFNGYLADVHFIDGQALTPSSFTEVSATTGQLIPKAYTGSFGTNGFHLPFSDNSTAAALGTDTSGNSNTWTVNNISVAAGSGNDSLVDTPTSYGTDTGAGGEVRGNYCTFNPLFLPAGGTLSNGNLDATLVGASATTSRDWAAGTILNSSGKWYYEVVATSYSSGTGVSRIRPGIVNPSVIAADFRFGTVLYRGEGSILDNNVEVDTGLPVLTVGDVVGIAYDLDALMFYVYINGTLEGSASIANVSAPFAPIVGNSDALTGTGNVSVNFGQRPFAYAAPSGFKALCDTNLPAPVVAKPNTVMDVKLYTGNGSTQTISGLGFSPDLVWIKSRSLAYNHRLIDTVRGAQKFLFSNTTDAEVTSTLNDRFTSFDATGFTLGAADSPSADGLNQNAATYVGWCWDAGSSTVTNTQGSITSQVRANASAGFSIVTWTGTGSNSTVGHGLEAAPAMYIVKSITNSLTWSVYHSALGADKRLKLDGTIAAQTSTTYWNNTAPTSAVFSVGTSAAENTSGSNQVTYCFAPVAGYSNGFSYTGNGSTDGPFVYLGFRPRWIILKRTDTSGDWVLHDTARDAYNVGDKTLYPNLSDAEFTVARLDELSNGFKLRSTSVTTNASGGTYIGFAFAENPFQYARAR